MNKVHIVIKKRRIQEQVYRKFSFEISIKFVNCFLNIFRTFIQVYIMTKNSLVRLMKLVLNTTIRVVNRLRDKRQKN